MHRYTWRERMRNAFNLNVSRIVVPLQSDLTSLPALEPLEGISVRRANCSDTEDCRIWVDLINGSYPDAHETVETFRRHCKNHPFLVIREVLFIELRGEVAATVSTGSYRRNAMVCGDARIAVARRFQRLGLGFYAVVLGFTECKKAGFSLAESVITHWREQSIRIHLRCGFRPQFDQRFVQYGSQRRLWPASALARHRVRKICKKFYGDLSQRFLKETK